MYDLIQSALTAAIEFTAVAGLTGIAAHAIWKQHTSWMSAYCPSVAPYTPDTQEEVAAPQPEPEVVAIAGILDCENLTSGDRLGLRPGAVSLVQKANRPTEPEWNAAKYNPVLAAVGAGDDLDF